MTNLQDKIEIIHEDDAILVLNKPFGLIVNRSNTTKEPTLQDFLIEYLDIPAPSEEISSLSNDPQDVFLLRSGMAHRLDKDTSGVILAAKTPESLQNLMSQFKNREVQKTYSALVHGKINDPIIDIDAPIGRNPKNRFRYAVLAEGKEAHTIVKMQKNSLDYSLVSVEPKTGRTHQIRVHLSAINHPIVGDVLYSPQSFQEKDAVNFGRLMLHASTITFSHPSNGEKVTFEVKIPSEFEKSL